MADKNRSDIENTETGAEAALAEAASPSESAEERAHREARRRILMGGLASAPVILTLASRPAMAGGSHHHGGGDYKKCGISGKLSGNLSHAHEDKTTWCRGKPPKYWKCKTDYCKRHFEPGPCNPIYSDYDYDDYSVPSKDELHDYRKKLERYSWNWYKIWKVDQYLGWLDQCPDLSDTPPFGTPFAEVFGGGICEDNKLTMMQALWLDDEWPYPPSGNAGPSPLLANIAAAYCNANEYGEDYFGLSTSSVVRMVQRDIVRDPVKLLKDLEMLNNQG